MIFAQGRAGDGLCSIALPLSDCEFVTGAQISMTFPKAPNFLLLGAAKSGTTSVFNFLGQHPDVFMPSVKEPHYFSLRGAKRLLFRGKWLDTPAWSSDPQTYAALFDSAGDQAIRADCSTSYLTAPEAPQGILETLGPVKLAVILREPIDRAYSHYLMGVRDGIAPATFAEALDVEQAEIASGQPTHVHNWYVRGSLYAAGLERYLARFDRSLLKVYFQEELRADTPAVLADLCRHLGIRDDLQLDTAEDHNVFGRRKNLWLWRLLTGFGFPQFRATIQKWVPKAVRKGVAKRLNKATLTAEDRPVLPEADRRRLAAALKNDMARLPEILGRPLPEKWLKAHAE
jgi:hypothetical protein